VNALSRHWMRTRLAVLAAAPLACVSAAAERPTLEVADDNPVVVEGRGFVAKERVTLRTTIGGQEYKRVVKADTDGRLKAQIAEEDAACLPFRVSAAGDRGSRAVTPRRIPPPCGVPIQP
jgi:hypothetical protein